MWVFFHSLIFNSQKLISLKLLCLNLFLIIMINFIFIKIKGGIMKKFSNPMLKVLLLLFCLAFCFCGTPGIVKKAVESNSPGAKIISVQEAEVKLSKGPDKKGEKTAWCVVYEEKNGDISRMVVTKGVTIKYPSNKTFKDFGCTNWSNWNN